MNMAERQKAQRERLAKALLASEAVQAIIGEPEYVIVRKVQRRFWHIEYAPESIVVVSLSTVCDGNVLPGQVDALQRDATDGPKNAEQVRTLS